MDENHPRTIEQVFRLLAAWRHLPGYRLEGRLAPFFELFLLDVLSARFAGIDLHPVVIPEFPLRIGTLFSQDALPDTLPGHKRRPGLNQSYNVDYVAFSADLSTSFLVELKTDMSSRRVAQDDYLRCAQKLPFRHLIGGITDLAAASDKKPKYVHLLHLLEKLDLVRLPDNGMLYDMTFPKPRAGWTRALEQVALTVDGKMSDSRVVYIQPLANDEDSDTGACYIGFDEVACTVQNFGDLGRTFAKNLRAWTTVAGSRDPRGADHDA